MSIEDVTGAGDIFLAAYVIGRILNRQIIADASQYAAKLVARQIDGNYIEPEVLALEDRIANPDLPENQKRLINHESTKRPRLNRKKVQQGRRKHEKKKR